MNTLASELNFNLNFKIKIEFQVKVHLTMKIVNFGFVVRSDTPPLQWISWNRARMVKVLIIEDFLANQIDV